MDAFVTEQDGPAGGAWPVRPLLLAGIGAAAALAIQQLLGQGSAPPVDRVAVAIGIGTAAVGFGFVAEKVRLGWAIAFTIVIGLAAGLIVYWQGTPGGSPDFWNWRLTSLFLAIAIAAPIFQTARDEGRWHFPYADLHGHAWTNVVLWFAGWIFVGVVFAMAWLLAALFNLVRIDFLDKLLQKDWVIALLIGAAFGGAVGLLRERDRIVRLLQRVVTAVLGVLAPVLGLGLLLFLVALPFTGLGALWEATRSTTPILLSCVIGALILANAVIGNGGDDEARNPVLRFGAMILALVMLPLVIIAAIATGLRINQYGFTPDRLWALTFVVLASAYGLAYLVSLARGRVDWAPYARSANVLLGFAVAAVALFLATPILSFNAISTADQVARLTSGKIKPEKFDWAALAFDFGAPGRAALTRLSRSANATTAERARGAIKANDRSDVASIETMADGADALAKRTRVQPREVPLPDGLLLSFQAGAHDTATAVLWYEPGGSSAVLVISDCDRCRPYVKVTRRDAKGEWKSDNGFAPSSARLAEDNEALKDALAKRGFEIRPVPRRQVYIDGKPVGEPFE
ncbi:MAG: hypothetical protein B7Y43_06310 [Sphingomonas sp. 28-62-20]|uniref:DUF4153 domain-containing protein n=1 Tax=Sphingomonas sp. 28-62-20 TaxID=1970433 RepID=UPI000BDDC8E1|nr:MAG: hypothetical protein B7Y43_06310 [Sphingomonas sp. 28-62-20]